MGVDALEWLLDVDGLDEGKGRCLRVGILLFLVGWEG